MTGHVTFDSDELRQFSDQGCPSCFGNGYYVADVGLGRRLKRICQACKGTGGYKGQVPIIVEMERRGGLGDELIRVPGDRSQPTLGYLPSVTFGWHLPRRWESHAPNPTVFWMSCHICQGWGGPPRDCAECNNTGQLQICMANVEILRFAKWASHIDPPAGRWAVISPGGALAIQSCDGVTLSTQPLGRRLETSPIAPLLAVLSNVEVPIDDLEGSA